ncbi:MAG: hypothetical protein KF681_13375 [Bdellovibrionaceae bacterium]|nr:hypothetical protein [Pseudobdellovibrionaceae bacterium]
MTKTVFALAFLALAVGFSQPSEARSKKRDSKYAEAKKVCLEENPGMSGKELRKCIKEKRK